MKNLALRMARGWIRHAPVPWGKPWLWRRMDWRRFDFQSSGPLGTTFRGNTTDVIQRYLHYFGVWEPDITSVITSRLQPGHIFIDVGANIGYYSMIASRRVGSTGRVVAIEASPKILRELHWHALANGATNVTILQKAAFDRRGILKLYDGDPENIGHTSLVGSGTSYQEVEAAPLCEILAEVGINRANLIKIDVEGAELEAVRGLLPFLQVCPEADLIIEISAKHMPGGQSAADEIFSMMAGLGYAAYFVPNSYSEERYIQGTASGSPQPVKGLPAGHLQADILFSTRPVT